MTSSSRMRASIASKKACARLPSCRNGKGRKSRPMIWSECSEAMMTRRDVVERMGCRWTWIVGVGVVLAASSGTSFCAETSSAAPVSKTLIVLALDAKAPVPIRTKFQEAPPTITITFPRQRVTGALPEHSAVGGGAIVSIAAQYDSRTSSQSKRFLDSIRIVLSGPYQYQVDSQAGRIVIEIQHPASISSTSVEVG